jgi:DEAD/DEAH box helicase domain-containing protein
MDVAALLTDLERQRGYRNQIVHIHEIPARAASYARPGRPLRPELQSWLAESKIDQLWSHQAAAIDATTAGRDIVVVTGTASGKTMCYNLPVAQALLEDANTRALYVFPTKALAQDQLATLQSLAISSPELGEVLLPATYDGDTPTYQRRKIRSSGSVILTNPDMLHQAILPQHGRWGRFLSDLRFIVLDEIHTYRGIFGSHVAGVLRRLQRVCEHYGARPQYICSSATIANPI